MLSSSLRNSYNKLDVPLLDRDKENDPCLQYHLKVLLNLIISPNQTKSEFHVLI